jgi:hypothetical protein
VGVTCTRLLKTAQGIHTAGELEYMTPKKKEEIVKELTTRFVICDRRSGQDIYYDLLRNKADCTHAAVVCCALEQGLEYNETRKSLLSRDKFKPVTRSKLYRPNKGKLIEEHGVYSINSWQRPAIIPDAELSAEPWIKHLELVLGSASNAEYFLDMLAYRFQNPSEQKPHVAFYFFGKEGGSGKTTLLRTLEHVFGNSAVKTTNTVKGLSSGSATELWSRTWLCIDEANIVKGSAVYDHIKSYTGDDNAESDLKYQGFGQFETPAQLIMISNRQPAFIEEADRRFFVSEWVLPSDIDRTSYFDELNNWLINQQGYEAIAGHLKTRHVQANHHTAPPMTKEKQAAMNLTKDPDVTAIEDYLENAKALLFTLEDLKGQLSDHYIKASRLKHILTEAGLVETGRIRVRGVRGQNRYWHKNLHNLTRTAEGNKLNTGDNLLPLEDCLLNLEASL